MRRIRNRERTAAIVTAACLAGLVASLLLAPMVYAEGCPGSAEMDFSCQQYPPQTLLGDEANLWLWFAAPLMILLGAVLLIRRATPDTRDPIPR